ncbi:aspartate aminotransferase [Alteromonadaceae bacterium Bs31]|nr:aspartate aminotransferase [Alteromonadaceae bacterium Bs31]
MFESLAQLPPDPILGLIAAYKQDPRPNKIDVGVGVYRDENGETPVLQSVKQAEQYLLASETSKAYVGPAGNPEFIAQMKKLILGSGHTALDRLALVQTPGGCGALRVAAELIKRAKAGARIWVSDPTWGNHIPLLGDAGVELVSYPYYNFSRHQICFDEMFSALKHVGKGDLVLFHACCHNPSGADLSQAQWQEITRLAEQQGFVPFIDMAYQGFGEGLDQDAYGIRLMCERLPEVLLAVSCSKNFGLYRERVGALALLSDQPQVASSHFANIVRGIYSMPPSHGASIVATILSDSSLEQQWRVELTQMRERIIAMRQCLVEKMKALGAGPRFAHIAAQQGMFSFLGITPTEVAALREQHAVYMVDTGRVSLAGLNDNNIDAFCSALQAVLIPSGGV